MTRSCFMAFVLTLSLGCASQVALGFSDGADPDAVAAPLRIVTSAQPLRIDTGARGDARPTSALEPPEERAAADDTSDPPDFAIQIRKIGI